jgi:hypothetical protein
MMSDEHNIHLNPWKAGLIGSLEELDVYPWIGHAANTEMRCWVMIALSGDYVKQRPARVVRSDIFYKHPSWTVLPVTSDQVQAPLFRKDGKPDTRKGLQKRSQMMAD